MQPVSPHIPRQAAAGSGHAERTAWKLPALCAIILALSITGCALKPPSASAGAGKPTSSSSTRLDAVEAGQAVIKSRLETQESTLLSMQEHIALLDSRLDMIEYRLGIGDASPHALHLPKPPAPQNTVSEPAPKAAPAVAPVAGNTPPPASAQSPAPGNGSAQATVAPAPAKAVATPAPANAPGQASAAPAPKPAPKVPAMSKEERAKMQKSFDDAMQLLKSGEYDKAASSLAAFVKQYPKGDQTSAARYWLGEAWFAQMQVPQAIDALKPFESMPVAAPKRAPALFRLGASYQRQGAKADAARAFEILRRDYPGSIEAENAARQMQRLGVVVPLSSGTAAPRPSKPTSSASSQPPRQRWAVNIVSLDNPADARDALAHLRAQGVHAKMMRVTIKGKQWYRLRIGGYASRDAANKVRLGFVHKGYAGAWTGPE